MKFFFGFPMYASWVCPELVDSSGAVKNILIPAPEYVSGIPEHRPNGLSAWDYRLNLLIKYK
ncbi:hypothetical protein DN748_17705 [Sinomicrobium soli]|nr:hypothetical protein DN748_17705 [Sinomicrobium sp. N-1-3-6]